MPSAEKKLAEQIAKAKIALKSGDIIAYPTEAVFGLGCDPFNEKAVQNIRQLKNRDTTKGLILIASDFTQIQNLIALDKLDDQKKIMDQWPGPITKIFPASAKAPKWVCAKNNTIAIRITDHPVAKKICEQFSGAIVSTSANPEGQTPAKTTQQIKEYFGNQINVIIDAPVGDLASPTRIIDAITGETLRS